MNLTKIPNGDEKVTVELTVKELMALAGVHFHANHAVKISARRKLNRVLEDTRGKDGKNNVPISYQFLN